MTDEPKAEPTSTTTSEPVDALALTPAPAHVDPFTAGHNAAAIYMKQLEADYVEVMLKYHNYEVQRDEGQKGMDLLRPRLDRLSAEMRAAKQVDNMFPRPTLLQPDERNDPPAREPLKKPEELTPRATTQYKKPTPQT